MNNTNNEFFISTNYDALHWFINSPLTNQELIDKLDPKITNQKHQQIPITNIDINTNDVNGFEPGQYIATLTVLFNNPNTNQPTRLEKPITIYVRKSAIQSGNDQQLNNKPAKKRHWLKYVILGLILIIGLIAFNQYQKNQQLNQKVNQQQSKINNDKIDKENLQNQINQLKEAQSQYHQDHNQEELDQALAQIKPEIADLKSDQAAQQMTDALNQVKNNPNTDLSKLQNQINQLKNENNNIVDIIKSNFNRLFQSNSNNN